MSAQPKGEHAAKRFLAKMGKDTTSCSFSSVYEDEHIQLLSDRKNRLTMLLAHDKYSHILNGNTVLFWSNEGAIMSATFKHSQEKFLTYWKNQIAELENGMSPCPANGINISCYKPQKMMVKPLLKDIMFGQGNPYNVLCPVRGNRKALIGCVPVACAQVMAMYRYPEHGVGEHKYMLDNNRTMVSKDFNDVYPNWDYVMKLNFNATNDSTGIYCMSTFLTAVSASLGADFGDERTGANVMNAETAMVNFWQYSPSMRCVFNECTDTIVGLMYREIDNARPVIVSDEGHCYVCDGYTGDYLHMNLGWGGRWNGFYRTRLSNGSKVSFPIKSIVIDIKPAGEVRTLSLNLKKPDMLRSMLSDDDMKHVNKLTLSGSLGNDDIVLLQQMLGAPTNDKFDWSGELCELDLSNVNFKPGTRKYYLSRGLKGNAGSTSRMVNDEFTNTPTRVTTHYNYDTMTDKEWMSFKAAGMHEREGYVIKRANGKCRAYYNVMSGVIGHGMFSECKNLRTIVLPNKVTKIFSGAFSGCSSLKNVGTHKGIVEIRKDAFTRCSMLEELHVRRSATSKFDLKAFQNCNPWVKYVYDL